MSNLKGMEKLLNVCNSITSMNLSVSELFRAGFFDAWVTCSNLALKIFDESISGAKGGLDGR